MLQFRCSHCGEAGDHSSVAVSTRCSWVVTPNSLVVKLEGCRIPALRRSAACPRAGRGDGDGIANWRTTNGLSDAAVAQQRTRPEANVLILSHRTPAPASPRKTLPRRGARRSARPPTGDSPYDGEGCSVRRGTTHGERNDGQTAAIAACNHRSRVVARRGKEQRAYAAAGEDNAR